MKSIIKNRKIYIWGARQEGYAARLAFSRHNIFTTGHIDNSPLLKGTKAFGLSITNPNDFFKKESPENVFVIIASGFFADEIEKECNTNGWYKGIDYVTYGDLRHFNYQIDVAGMCNLKCISCPRGNWPRHRKPGLMPPDNYSKLIKKILKDDPWTGIITLYNWGEPLLNPSLPEIIKITKNNGLLSAISSNLAMEKDFEDVIKARPNWFRISNSGWDENYEITHTGAKWKTFYSNCKKLSKYKQIHNPDMIVELFFHIYNHNKNDYMAIKSLCNYFGFVLRLRNAALAPLDNINLITSGKEISKAAARTQELQSLSVKEAMDIAYKDRNRPCYYTDHLWIDWDLSIASCMEWYDPSLKLLDKNFLEVTLDEIKEAQINNTHCLSCKSKGIHRCYAVYSDEKLIK